MQVKICGIRDSETLNHLMQNKADFFGLVFYPKSPRFCDLDSAKNLWAQRQNIKAVGLFVDADDDLIQSHAPFVDMIQLHGNESPARVREIRAMTEKPVIKAISIANIDDLSVIPIYEQIADWILLDAKPTQSEQYGGTGHAFDWALLKNIQFRKQWMLAGGINIDNVADIFEILKNNLPDSLDLSSGVEIIKGQKDLSKITEILKTISVL
jgi:phosphoribosylanthranilate isomerase